MVSFLQQIINILIEPPGNLIYHLVLAFSAAGALQAALNAYDAERSGSALRRLLLGLSLLLLLRLVLFLAAGAAWQGLANERLILPPVDRLVSLLSLVLVIWLWSFPQRTRLADAASLLLALLVLTASGLGLVWWNSQGLQESFNNSWTSFGLAAFGAVLALVGMILLYVRREYGWGSGFAMCALLLAGHLLQLYTGDMSSDYAGIVRLAEITAYPLLLVLPGRVNAPVFSAPLPAAARESGEAAPLAEIPAERPQLERRGAFAAAELLQASLRLSTSSKPEEKHLAIAHVIAQSFLADLCLLVTPPGLHGDMKSMAAYDLIRARSLPKLDLKSTAIPVITSSFRRGRSVRLPASSTSPDLPGLAELLELDHSGSVAAVPVRSEGNKLVSGIILLAPYSGRSFNEEDLRRLEETTPIVAQLLQQSSSAAGQQADLEATQRDLEKIRQELEQARQERSSLQALLAEISGKESAQTTAPELVTRLQQENEQLRRQLELTAGEPPARAPEAALRQSLLNAAPDQASEGELRLALEEVAQLTLALSEADKRIQELKAHQAGQPADAGPQTDLILSIVQELRQPMSSIIGYTDFLLGESVGLLGALQRKFLERVRVSAFRITRLVEELNELAAQQKTTGEQRTAGPDLSQVIDEALLQTSSRLRQKDITLRLDLPEPLPELQSDPSTLQQILERLLENASLVTPDQGQIALRLRLHADGSSQNYALIQVTDQGGGIGLFDLPRLFTPQNGAGKPGEPAANGSIPGLGLPAVEMTRVKLLADILGGRLWVESESGAGATYSLLLPVETQRRLPPAQEQS